jgi:hypothetical protein
MRIPRCVLSAVICIGLFEILLGRTDFAWKMVPGSHIDSFLALEETIIQKHPMPTILIFGSSRARGAFLPTLMEEQMGLQRGEVLNLGLGSGRPIHALKIYQQNRDILAQADIVIIEVESWQFALTIPPNELDLYRYVAGWSDVLAYKGENRYSLVRSLLFRLPDAVPYLRIYVKHWLTEKHAPESVGIDKYGRLALVRIANDHDEERFQDEHIANLLDWTYRNYEYSEVAQEYLIKLVRLAKEDGASVYVLRMPSAGNFVTRLKQHDRNPYGQFRENVQLAIADLADGVQFWEFPTEIGLNDQDFRDPGHFNTGGAIQWTKFFVRWLRSVQTTREGMIKGS